MCVSGTMCHDECEAINDRVTVHAGFDLVIIPFAVSGQRKAMQQRSLLRCTRSLRGSVSSE